jgi:hypothetical protein
MSKLIHLKDCKDISRIAWVVGFMPPPPPLYLKIGQFARFARFSIIFFVIVLMLIRKINYHGFTIFKKIFL